MSMLGQRLTGDPRRAEAAEPHRDATGEQFAQGDQMRMRETADRYEDERRDESVRSARPCGGIDAAFGSIGIVRKTKGETR